MSHGGANRNLVAYSDERKTDVGKLITVNPFKVTQAMYRFLKFLALVSPPITEQKIMDYYEVNVRRYVTLWDTRLPDGTWSVRGYTRQERKRNALSWFDRWLGKMLREKVLTDQAKDIVQAKPLEITYYNNPDK